MKVPFEETLIQNTKSGSGISEELSLKAIATEIAESMEKEVLYVLGPGTSIRAITDILGLSKTLLGVDVILNGKLIEKDVNEEKLSELIKDRKARIIVTIIGGQGFVFGRGNQQISPKIIRSIGKKNIIIIATPAKIASLQGRPLIVDTGDSQLDKELRGYYKIKIDYRKTMIYKLTSGRTV
jgi:predicted polyphosphate/ATP-dependent NAD kinase